jgi:hypothetical protein
MQALLKSSSTVRLQLGSCVYQQICYLIISLGSRSHSKMMLVVMAQMYLIELVLLV